MEFRILNKDLLDVDILDTYESMIWTDRYSRFETSNSTYLQTVKPRTVERRLLYLA